MATKLYAWSRIRYGSDTDKNGNFLGYKETAVGDEVTAEKLGLNKDQLAELVESGSVRTMPYPDMGSFVGSPVDWYREQARKAAEGILGDANSSDEVVAAAMAANAAATGASTVEPDAATT